MGLLFEVVAKKNARTFSEHVNVEKFNPYHGKDGRFTSAGAAASFTYAPGKSKAHDNAIKNEAERYARPAAAAVVKAATEAEPELTKTMQGLADKYGAEMVGLEFAVKSEDSLTRKVSAEVLATGGDPETIAKGKYDVNRYTMQGDEKNLASIANGTIGELRSQGYKVVELKNTLANEEAEYRGINMKLQDPNGVKIELQFHTAKSLEVKEINHKLYEEQREVTTSKARREELGKMMKANAKSIPTPDDIASVANVKWNE